MNAKRQTIWLVSMLSLMVVLSAYYLFTEDVNKLDMTTTGSHDGDIKVTTKESTDAKAAGQPAAGANGQAAAGTGAAAAGKAGATGATATAANDANAGGTLTDAEVLKQLSAQGASGADYIVALQVKRNQQLSEETSKWMAIANDSKQSNDQVSKALEELHKIETQQAQTNAIEDTLGKTYKNAIVTEDNGKYQVTVQADKLEKSDAVSIVDLVMKDLGVTQDKVEIKRIS